MVYEMFVLRFLICLFDLSQQLKESVRHGEGGGKDASVRER